MLKATTPKEHKSLGRKVRNFDHKLWDESECLLATWNVFSMLGF